MHSTGAWLVWHVDLEDQRLAWLFGGCARNLGADLFGVETVENRSWLNLVALWAQSS